MDLRLMEGFLGTGASMLADITLLAYVLLIIPVMVVGFVFARRKMFVPHHKLIMTIIVIINWLIIIWLMMVSYSQGVAPGIPASLGDIRIWLPTLHLVIGGLAQLLGTYLVLRMWFENVLPEAVKVKNIKVFMRMTLAGWLLAALLGVGIYSVWYVLPSPQGDTGTETITPPDATEEAISNPDATEEPATAPDATEEPVVAPDATEEA